MSDTDRVSAIRSPGEQLAGVANGSERAAQLMGQHGEEVVLAAIRCQQTFLGLAQGFELLTGLILAHARANGGLHGADQCPRRSGRSSSVTFLSEAITFETTVVVLV